MSNKTPNIGGRPPVDPKVWNLAVDMFNAGKTKEEVRAATGLGKSSVYTADKYRQKREVPQG